MLKTAKGGRKHRSAVSFCCDSSFAAPRGGRDANPPADYDVNPISTRAPRTGRDRIFTAILSTKADFNPRAPCGARRQTNCNIRPLDDFNPRAPCGARREEVFQHFQGCQISILAPRAGRDLRGLDEAEQRNKISILAPRAGRDCELALETEREQTFQSSRPVRGATSRPFRGAPRTHNFNPRAPCGARRCRGRPNNG